MTSDVVDWDGWIVSAVEVSVNGDGALAFLTKAGTENPRRMCSSYGSPIKFMENTFACNDC